MSDPFSVLAHAQNQFHLDVLEADFVKVHSSELMSTENNCQGAIPSVGNADSPVFSHFLLVIGVSWLWCNLHVDNVVFGLCFLPTCEDHDWLLHLLLRENLPPICNDITDIYARFGRYFPFPLYSPEDLRAKKC